MKRRTRRLAILVNIKFLVKLGWSGSDIHLALTKAYGEKAASRSHIFMWIRKFKATEESKEPADDQCEEATTFDENPLAITDEIERKEQNSSRGSVEERVSHNETQPASKKRKTMDKSPRTRSGQY